MHMNNCISKAEGLVPIFYMHLYFICGYALHSNYMVLEASICLSSQ